MGSALLFLLLGLSLVLALPAALAVWKPQVSISPDVIEQNHSEPNQTFWKELCDLPSEKTNYSSLSIPTTTEIIILIPINSQKNERREEIRESWANSRVSEAIRFDLVRVLFLITDDKDSRKEVKEEILKYGDLLVVGGVDNYKNLIYKEMRAFKWANRFYPNVTIVKADSDVVVEVDRLHESVEKLDLEKKIAAGWIWQGGEPNRDPNHRWYVSYYSHPGVIPPFVNGPFYLLSPPALSAIIQKASDSLVYEVEDGFFTGTVSQAAGVLLIYMEGVNWEKPYRQDCNEGNPTVIAYPIHNLKSGEMKQKFEEMKNIQCKRFWDKIFG